MINFVWTLTFFAAAGLSAYFCRILVPWQRMKTPHGWIQCIMICIVMFIVITAFTFGMVGEILGKKPPELDRLLDNSRYQPPISLELSAIDGCPGIGSYWER